MSWDFSMSYPAEDRPCDKCGGAGRIAFAETLDLGANYTYNVSPMFYEAMPSECREEREVGYPPRMREVGGVGWIEGKRGAEAAPKLRQALRAMEADPARYRAMNPANGWGDYEGACALLRKLAEWGEAHPHAVYEIF